jgi:hypothetical protein
MVVGCFPLYLELKNKFGWMAVVEHHILVDVCQLEQDMTKPTWNQEGLVNPVIDGLTTLFDRVERLVMGES